MNGPSQDVNALPAIGEFNPIEGTMAEYEIASDLTGIFVEPPGGLVVHYAGPIGKMVISGSLWVAKQSALDFFAARAGDGLTEFIRLVSAPQRDPNVSYQLKPVESSVVGQAAPEFVMRPRGEARGAVLVRTSGAALPSDQTPGLILAAKLGEIDDNMLYEFYDAEPAEVKEYAEVIHLHSIFATDAGLSDFGRHSA